MPEDLFDRSRFDSLLIDFLEFIEVLLQFEKAVPVGIIRGSHHRTLPGPTSLMMPEVVESDLEFIEPEAGGGIGRRFSARLPDRLHCSGTLESDRAGTDPGTL